jgi:hypothetical protein
MICRSNAKRLREFLIKSGVLSPSIRIEPAASVAAPAEVEPVIKVITPQSVSSDAQQPSVGNGQDAALKSSVDSDEEYCKVSHEDVQEEETVPIPSLANSALHRRLVNK